MRKAPVLAALLLILLPFAAHAAGPLNGSYQVETGLEEFGPFYFVVLQNDPQLGFAMLDPVFGWGYGAGLLQGARATGTLFTSDSEPIGTWELNFGPEGQFTGTIVDSTFVDVTIPVVGKRFF